MIRGLADIGAEGVLLAGAGRAILLQVADPAVGHGLAEHSTYSERPLQRLGSTLTYVYAVVYGSEGQLAAVRRRVNRAHAAVRRPGDGQSRGYNAFDPRSQLWVAATLYDTAVTVYEQVYGTLPVDAADAIYRESAKLGTALQLPPELWPADRAAFRAYWQGRLDELEPDDVAKGLARELLYPAGAPLVMRLALPLARLLSAGFLPEGLRKGFGLPWDERRRRTFTVVMRALAATYPRLPRRVRHWPKDRLLARLEGQLQS